MVIFTLNRNYAEESEIDYFNSAIWTERFAGDADFQLVVPGTPNNIQTLATGTFVGEADSDEVMVVETQTFKGGVLKVTGRSLTQHLDDRIVRFTANHHDKTYAITGTPGYILQYLVQNMAIDGAWLNGTSDMGIPNPQRLKIRYFTVDYYDQSLASITLAVPYGQLFSVMKSIAETYGLGQKIARVYAGDIRYRNWVGIDRTSDSGNPVVRFSTEQDNFGDTTEVVDATKFKTHAWTFGSAATVSDNGGIEVVGEDTVVGTYTDWDLKAAMVLADDLNVTGVASAWLTNQLAQRSYAALEASPLVSAIDGTIMPGAEFVYGTHYKLGDIVETQGLSGIVKKSRVTEYIRSQDDTGEKAYPTLVAVS